MCTANINRSVMAEALLGARIARDRTDGNRVGQVASAGLLQPNEPASSGALAAMANRSLDLTKHRSRRLSPELVQVADLILTMERRHLREAAVMALGALAKTYTLKEFVRLGLEQPRRQPDEPLAALLARLDESRDHGALLSDDVADEVADPVGGTSEDFERTAEELDLLIAGVVWLLWP